MHRLDRSEFHFIIIFPGQGVKIDRLAETKVYVSGHGTKIRSMCLRYKHKSNQH